MDKENKYLQLYTLSYTPTPVLFAALSSLLSLLCSRLTMLTITPSALLTGLLETGLFIVNKMTGCNLASCRVVIACIFYNSSPLLRQPPPTYILLILQSEYLSNQ